MTLFRVESTEGKKVEVTADYYQIDDVFLTFKDAQHKQVASFNKAHVLAVLRNPGQINKDSTTA
jgi:hypothetical protein